MESISNRYSSQLDFPAKSIESGLRACNGLHLEAKRRAPKLLTGYPHEHANQQIPASSAGQKGGSTPDMNALDYSELVSRNHTYVPEETQKRIRNTRLLVAGVGMGSTVAEAAVRLGFENLALIDGDTVEGHNLNRQAFTAGDIHQPKVDALATRLRAINPNAAIREFNGWLCPENAADFVSNADFIFDAIDFLSLEAIVALHDECRRQGKPIVSVASAGFGAMAIYFPPDNPHTIRDVFGLPASGSVADASYVKNFAQIVRRISAHLDPLIVTAMEKTFAVMEDGTPCPAPHTVMGSNTMAALAMTMAVRIFQGEPVTEAPEVILLNLSELCSSSGLNLTAAQSPAGIS